MIVAIHQPNFMPWYPFFQKIAAADVFCILTHCQFEKNNYQNRFHQNGRWHTMSVNKGLEPIKDKRYVSPENDWNRIKVNLKDYEPILTMFDDLIMDNLASTNIAIIRTMCRLLKIETKITTDWETELMGTERLVEICSSLGATTYLAGSGGSRDYLDVSLFAESGIDVRFQDEIDMIKVPTLEILEK